VTPKALAISSSLRSVVEFLSTFDNEVLPLGLLRNEV